MTNLELKSVAVRICNMSDTLEAQLKILENELPTDSREFWIIKNLLFFLQTPRSSDSLDAYLSSLLD